MLAPLPCPSRDGLASAPDSNIRASLADEGARPIVGSMRSTLFALLITLVHVASVSSVSAHDRPLHPAHKIAERYLTSTHLHQWTYAVRMIETKSLENMKKIQRRFLMNAPTIGEEEELLRHLNLSSISDLDALKPDEVFIRRAKANTKGIVDAAARIAQVKKSLALKTLSTARESDSLVHALIRVEYQIKDRAFSELALVSLTKEGTVWKISLDAQEPSIRKIVPKDKGKGTQP